MSQLPSIIDPFCFADIGDDSVTVEASSIYGGSDSDDYIASITFKLTKNSEDAIEYTYLLDSEVSSIVSHVFDVGVQSLDAFSWEITVDNKIGSTSFISGINIYSQNDVSDVRIFIGHKGVSVVHAEEYDTFIRTTDYKQGNGVIFSSELKAGNNVILVDSDT